MRVQVIISGKNDASVVNESDKSLSGLFARVLLSQYQSIVDIVLTDEKPDIVHLIGVPNTKLYDKAKRGTPLSNKELDELKDLNERDPAKQKEKADKELEKARKEAEEKQKQKDEAEQKLKDDVSEIVTLMRQLGLK